MHSKHYRNHLQSKARPGSPRHCLHPPESDSPIQLPTGRTFPQVCQDPMSLCSGKTSHYPRYKGLALWRHDFIIGRIRKPSVLPYVNPLPTAYSPNSTLLNDLSSLQNTPPSIRTLLRNMGFHNTPMRDIFCIKNLVKQNFFLVNQSPHLFGQ